MVSVPAAFESGLGALRQTPPPAPQRGAGLDAARRSAEEFEAFFLSQVLEHMFKGIATDGPFGGGPGETAMRPLLMQEFGKVIAKAGGIGIADAVMRELIQSQEVGQK